jgi:hypothetical protein
VEKSIALSNILYERKRQDEKWGEQNHQPMEWLMILGEEVGEANKAALEANFGGKEIIKYRDELVHVAAVALAAIESFDRKEHKSIGRNVTHRAWQKKACPHCSGFQALFGGEHRADCPYRKEGE